MTHNFTFLRHGYSEGNRNSILQGQLDSELVPEGKQQIHSLSEGWKIEGRKFDRIISSPQVRARQTAEIVAMHLKAPIEEDATWMERNFGAGQGLPLREYDQLLKTKPSLSIYAPPYEEGESRWQLNLRAVSAIEKLTKLEPGSYLIVSHGGFLNTLFRVIFGDLPRSALPSLRIRIPNGAYTDFEFNANNGQWTLTRLMTGPVINIEENHES